MAKTRDRLSVPYLIAMIAVGPVWAHSMPSTAPDQISNADIASAFMISYDRLAGSDPDAYLPMFSISGGDDLRLARAEASFDAQVGMLQKIVELLWGDDAVNQTLHALAMQTADDARSAKVVETGDHATVTYADGTAGPSLIKTSAGWRLDTAAFRKALGMSVDDYTKRLRETSLIVADIADRIDQRHLRSADAVAHEIAAREARSDD